MMMPLAPTPRLASLHTEENLLLNLVGSMETSPDGELCPPGAAVNWGRLTKLAETHGVAPLAWQALARRGPNGIPEQVLEELRRQDRDCRQQSLVLMRDLICLLETFNAAGLAVIPFKGPLMVQAIYGDLGLRWIGDLDFLVRPEDVLKFKTVMLDLGYEASRTFTPAQEQAYLKLNCEYNFEHPASGLHVEIHWRYFSSHFGYQPMREVWERARPVTVSGLPALMLTPEDLLLYLCMHGRKHTWESLKFVCDLARFMEAPADPAWAADWDALFAEARRLGWLKTVWQGLYLAHDLLGAPLPAPMRLTPADEQWLRMQTALLRGRIFRKRYGLPGFGRWRDYLERPTLPGPGTAAQTSTPQLFLAYLRHSGVRVMLDLHYLTPEIPGFLSPLRRVIWGARHYLIQGISRLRRRRQP